MATASSMVFLVGDGQRYTAANAEEAKRFQDAGFEAVPAETLNAERLAQQYSGWQFAASAFAQGAGQIATPGLQGAALEATSLVDKEAGKTAGEYVQGVEAAHPWAHRLGEVAGLAGLIASGGASALAGGASRLAVAGAAAGTGALMGLDAAATQHVQTQEGIEKLAASVGLSAALAVPLAFVAPWALKYVLKGGVRAIGEVAETAGAKMTQKTSPLENPGVLSRLETKGPGVEQRVADLAEEHNLLTLSPSQLRAKLSDIAKTAEADMNQAKAVSTATMPISEHVAWASKLHGELADTPLKDITKARLVDTDTVGALHALRQKIDKSLNYGDATSEVSQRLTRARETVDDYLTQVFDHNAKVTPAAADQADRWAQANADYSAARHLQDALRFAAKGEGPGAVATTLRALKSAGRTSATFGALGGNPGTVAGGAALWGGAKIAEAGMSAVPSVVKGLGKGLQEFDSAVVQTITRKLGGAEAAAAGPAGKAAFTLATYAATAATVQQANLAPVAHAERMATALQDQGVPPQLIDALVPFNLQTMAYLNSLVPPSPWTGQTATPAAHQPTLEQRARLMEAVNAINSPLDVLAAPTPGKVAAWRAVYPVQAQKVTMIVTQEAQAQPNLSASARRWVAQITGQPATPLGLQHQQVMLQTAPRPQLAAPVQTKAPAASLGQTQAQRLSE